MVLLAMDANAVEHFKPTESKPESSVKHQRLVAYFIFHCWHPGDDSDWSPPLIRHHVETTKCKKKNQQAKLLNNLRAAMKLIDRGLMTLHYDK